MINGTKKEKLHLLSKRKPFKMKKAWCSRSSIDYKRSRLLAEGKISEELDIVHFIKQQKFVQVVFELLFSREERYLLSKNKRLTIAPKI